MSSTKKKWTELTLSTFNVIQKWFNVNLKTLQLYFNEMNSNGNFIIWDGYTTKY